MTKTTNYQLNQWDPTDRVLRTDFNSDNQKIDAALSGMPKIVFGSYTGNGTASHDFQRDITVGFTPRIVLLMTSNGTLGDSNPFGGIFFTEKPLYGNNYSVEVALIIENGFRIQGQYQALNRSGIKYYWLAIG